MFSVKTSLKLYSCFLFCGVRFSRAPVNAARLWLIVVKRAFRSPTKETDKRGGRRREEHDQEEDEEKMDAIVVFAGFCTEKRETEMDLPGTHEPRNRIATNLVKGCSFR
ncbi:uncharacterized protein LOC104880313 [Vitis vinifera]|uniref:uncharacterized protein LOC104880313 n=1 Tax=Vitis vinifera TaxID=29760 RepID=UPI00053F6B48|nr:uncharacterized protein LOC104880313 [Vitis vinifera]|eukprot:XP_010654932.1 PREDICTED: uncharacterized protein LOC104880313 [Vitis vinifera]